MNKTVTYHNLHLKGNKIELVTISVFSFDFTNKFVTLSGNNHLSYGRCQKDNWYNKTINISNTIKYNNSLFTYISLLFIV